MRSVARTTLALLGLVTLTACRTEYRTDVTKECMDEATAISLKARDAGFEDPNPICEECCHRKGFSNVEPGYCSCGKLGLDALLK